MRRAGRTALGAAVLALVVPAAAGAQSLDVARVDAALRGFRAIDLDGREWSYDDLRGRVVLLDFWATWCAPCLAEVPYQQELVARYPEDLLIIGISLDRAARRDVVRWLNQQRVGWPQVHDGRGYGGELALSFGVEHLPTSVLIDHQGRVRAFDRRGEELLAAVERLIRDARRPAPDET